MRALCLLLTATLAGCASQDLSWVDQETSPVSHDSPQALLLPNGERTPASELTIPRPPKYLQAQAAERLQVGRSVDGNGVSVLTLAMDSASAIDQLQAALPSDGVRVVSVDETGSFMVLQSEAFLSSGEPSWFNRYDQRVRLIFSDIGEQSRVSVWTLEDRQPRAEVRDQVFRLASTILLPNEQPEAN